MAQACKRIPLTCAWTIYAFDEGLGLLVGVAAVLLVALPSGCVAGGCVVVCPGVGCGFQYACGADCGLPAVGGLTLLPLAVLVPNWCPPGGGAAVAAPLFVLTVMRECGSCFCMEPCSVFFSSCACCSFSCRCSRSIRPASGCM